MALSISTLNTNGCRNPFRMFQVLSFLRQGGYSVSFLQETHTTPELEASWNLEWKGRVFFNHLTWTSCGVVTLFSDSFQPEVLSATSVIPGRLLHLRVRESGRTYNLMNVYAPTTGPERARFFESLSAYMETIDSDEALIIGGDFNYTLDARDRNVPKKRDSSESVLRELIAHFSLVDVWREQNPETVAFTYVRVRDGHVSQSRIDRIYISSHLMSRAQSSTIRLAPFSDHNCVSLRMSIAPSLPKAAYWHFNNSLLEDEGFAKSVRDTWRGWRAFQDEFATLNQWWDVGKVHLKLLCQEYTKSVSGQRNAEIEALNGEVLDLEQRLSGSEDQALQCEYLERKEALRNMEQRQARGAFVRSRMQLLCDMDRGSRFFYALEKKKGNRKQITCLFAEDGTPLEDPEAIRDRARSFYQNLFSPDPISPDACEELWDGLPVVSERRKERLETPITLDELSQALRLMPHNKSPGLDGLTIEFFQFFWDTLGPDFHRVLTEAFKKGELPLSCRRAVLSLLPKKGDLRLIKNWRPVSLLSTDYKIVAKAISLRLKSVLAEVIHPDQSYTVPGRTIFDNVFLIRDLLHFARRTGLSLAFLSLDQEKAFDRVDHQYLIGTLQAYSFGPQFVGYLKTMYASAECLVKINWSLTAPLAFGRGVRQGCPLSGQLYSLAIEPFLCLLRKRLTGLVLKEPDMRVVLSAYADDVILVAQDLVDLERAQECQEVYAAASSARINWSKSSGLLEGSLKVDFLPPAFRDISWESKIIKYLGVYLSAEEYPVSQNFIELEECVLTRLGKWKGFAKVLSMRGRALVINQLVASQIWYRLICLSPTQEFIAKIQRRLLDFLWIGKHWVSAGVSSLPLKEGGQGVVCIRSQVHTFRLQQIQRYLYADPSPQWCTLASSFYRQVRNMGYDRQLFIIEPEGFLRNLSTLPAYYQDTLKTWSMVSVLRQGATEGEDILNEPLLYNPSFKTRMLESISIRRRLCQAQLTRVGDLLDFEKSDWVDSQAVMQRMGFLTTRVPHRLLKEIKDTISPDSHTFIDGVLHAGEPRPPWNSSPPDIIIAPKTRQSPQAPPSPNLSQLENFPLTRFHDITRKLLYSLMLHTVHFLALISRYDTIWRRVLNEGERPQWRAFYSSLVPRPTGDLSWKVLHGALSTGEYLARFTDSPAACPFCGKGESVFHAYFTCARLQPLLALLRKLYLQFWLHFSPHVYIFGRPVSRDNKEKDLLSNLLLALAKLVIHKSRKQCLEGGNPLPAEVLFRVLVRSRIRAEYTQAVFTGRLKEFADQWAIDGVLCSVSPDLVSVQTILTLPYLSAL
uniref:Transposon TX1 uncharacterized 149 kDa protein n=1 Tax=Xenopus laevis TaxID=8355 RepID=YTX2_XENLA|nr:RecName: Full=Transposon TX1 uncharacterized 149 kDa protein; AltName: Full=ORF 2 [Xenopus laevis]AAA49976.1 ORF2 [Xenopus laevis]